MNEVGQSYSEDITDTLLSHEPLVQWLKQCVTAKVMGHRSPVILPTYQYVLKEQNQDTGSIRSIMVTHRMWNILLSMGH